MKNIVFVGLQNIPYARRAVDVRLMAFANIMSKKGNKIYISNLYTTIPKDKRIIDVKISNNITILDMLDISNSTNIIKKIFILLSIFIEFFNLVKLNSHKKIDVLHVSSGHYLQLLVYKLLSKVVNAKMICQYMEFRSAIERQNVYHKTNGKLIDKFGYKLSDGVICISNFLVQHIHKIKPTMLTIKIPPICDFEYINSIDRSTGKKYFLFCGFAGYLEVIKMIIDSYNLSIASNNNISLIIVTNGTKEEIDKVQRNITNACIEILSDVPYVELISLYKNAISLLIPLRNTQQDQARFPNKICEYIASKSTILSTSFGEMPYYFKDELNAVLSEKFDALSISHKMNWIIRHQDLLPIIEDNAYKIGLEYFDTRSYINTLDEFLNKVIDY